MKCRTCLSDCDKTTFSGQVLIKVSQYKIPRKSVQWQSSCSVRTEIMKLIVVSAPSRTRRQSATARRAYARAHAHTHKRHYLDSTDICFETVSGWPLASSENCAAPLTLCTSLLVFQYLCCGHSSVLTGILMRVPVCGCMSHLLCNGSF